MRDARPSTVPVQERRSRRGAWRILIRERFALPALLVVTTGQAASAQYIVSPRLDLPGLVIAALCTTALMALLRLMDELKDLDTDRLAHPERPIPRGAISESEARRGLAVGTGTLFAVAALIGIFRSPWTGFLYAFTIICALLMYREFFIPEYLSARPLSYAVTHQIIVPAMYVFATASGFPDQALSAPVLWFALAGMGASLAVEVSRKLDPAAHPALRTYLHTYGAARTALIVVASVTLVAVAAQRLGLQALLWPAVAVVLVTLPVIFFRPLRHRWVAAAAVVLVLVQVLAPTLHHLWGAFR